MADIRVRKVQITLASSLTPSNQTDYQLTIDRNAANFPDEAVDPSSVYHARSDGQDIYFTTDEAGLTKLPCEIVNFEYDSSTGAGDAVIKIKIKLNVTGSTDTTLWMWYNSVGSQPVPGSTYGSENVYPSTVASIHHGKFSPIREATTLYFMEPSAQYYNGKTYHCWCDSLNNNIRIAVFTHSTNTWSTAQSIGTTASAGEAHHSPTLLVDSSGYIWVFWGDFSDAVPSLMNYIKSTNPEDITAWGTATDIGVSGSEMTFPSAMDLGSGNIALFYRDGGSIKTYNRILWNGSSWGSAQVICQGAGSGSRPYPRVKRDGSGRVHMAYHWFDGVASQHHDLYYAYSDDIGSATSTWHSADGTSLTLPLAEGATQLVFNSDAAWDTAYLADFDFDSSYNPHIVIGVTHSVNTDEYLHFTYSSGWSNSTIVADNGIEITGYTLAGSVDGGLNADTSTSIQFAFCISVSGIYEIQEYSTTDGSTWSKLRDITSGSSLNNRQISFPLNWSSECRMLFEWADAIHYNTGYGDICYVSSYNDYIPSIAPVLSDSTTFVRDSTANHVDLTAVGTPATVTGNNGTAFSFNGTTDYLWVAANTPTDEAITLSCMTYTTDNTVSQAPIGLGNNGSSGQFSLSNFASSGVRCYKQSDAGTTVHADTVNTISNSTWHHVAGRLVGQAERYSYLDMDTVNKGTETTSVADPTVDFFSIGCVLRSTAGTFMKGYVEDAVVYNVDKGEDYEITIKNNLKSMSSFVSFGTPKNTSVTTGSGFFINFGTLG